MRSVTNPPDGEPPSVSSSPPQNLGRNDNESSLLPELAKEAAKAAGQDNASNSEVIARHVHEALRSIFRFFVPFCEYANCIGPEIQRSYRLDTRAAYANLEWRGAFASSRNRDMAESALLDHVTFSVHLHAPEPVIVRRRWDQLQTLKTELRILHLRALDDLDVVGEAKQEWYELRLAPDIPVLMLFQGNFSEGRIDVLTSNFDGFGIAAFEIELEDVAPKLLDGVGRFLIGRSNVLPLPLRRVHHPIKAATSRLGTAPSHRPAFEILEPPP